MKKLISDLHILVLSWRDIHFPDMGGAEILTHEMLKGAVLNGVKVTHFAPHDASIPDVEIIDGIKYVRKGTLWSVIFEAQKYYHYNEDNIDFVIDQCNTFRFFSKFWVPKSKRIFLIYQLTREIWDINLRFPFSKIGKMLETTFLKLNKNDYTITESQSTKDDLVTVGFKPERIYIIPIGLKDEILNIPLQSERKKNNYFIYVGRYSKYKGIDVAVESIGILKSSCADAKLWIVGRKDNEYIKNQLKPICKKYSLRIGDEPENDIVTWGFLSDEKKFELQKNAKALVFPSVREGWGMIITEAGALGTPSITYDAPGCRDAVCYGKTGYLCKKKNAEGIAGCMKRVIEDEDEYENMRVKAWEFANKFSFDNSRGEFLNFLKRISSDTT